MQTNFRIKEKEAEWKEMRRQSKNDLDYEIKQAQRECADRIDELKAKHGLNGEGGEQ